MFKNKMADLTIVDKEIKGSADIVYSCYHTTSRQGEQFVPANTISFLIAGSLTFTNGKELYKSEAGAIRLVKGRQLLKFTKEPPENGEFKSISVYLGQEKLQSFSIEYGIKMERRVFDKPVCEISPGPLLRSYAESIRQYHENARDQTAALTDLKIKELILLVLQSEPDLKNILFDFTEPHKSDLREFMNKNYHFNVHLDRFAYLTGRSLAAFKRDFEKLFNTTPGRWLQERRLQEAFYQITQKGKSASDIYLDLGFEDLSHFSFAFKKQFGKAPSKILA